MMQTRNCLHLHLKAGQRRQMRQVILPHKIRNNVPRFTLPLPYKSLFTQFLHRLQGCKLDAIMVLVLAGVLNGNIIVLRIPISLTGYQAIRDDIIFILFSTLLIMKQPSKWHIKPVNYNI